MPMPDDVLSSDNYTSDEADLILRIRRHGTKGIAFIGSAEASSVPIDAVKHFVPRPRG
jgi:hypothetical protein